MDIFSLILLPFFIAFISTTILTPACILFIKKMGLVDDPITHKHPAIIHKHPVPRGGGIPLFLGVLIAAILFLPKTPITIATLTASFISLASGLFDDKYDTSRYARLIVNIVCAFIVVASGVAIHFITHPLGGIFSFDNIYITFLFMNTPITITFSHILSMIWIVWVMNMLNWSKGVDGQMPGIVAISAIIIGILSLRFSVLDASSILSAQLSFIIAGASLGFLLYNFYPARIFPGYGATCLYLLLGVVSILSGAKLATAILVMGVPMIDGMFTIIRRIATGRSPFWHDKKHLHHILLNRGWNQQAIALFYWIISAILGALALSLSSKGKLFAIIMLVVLVGGALLFLHLTLQKDDEKTSS